MDILVIGGTRFLGRAFVDAALERGHRLTLFNRGTSGPGLFRSVDQVRGDRDGGLEPLAGRPFDAVLDTCGYVPRVVAASAELLAPTVERYVFISSISVYADESTPGQDEWAPVAQLDPPTVEEITAETYGGLKALCERRLEEALSGRALIVRPGLIVGPNDPTDRFTYWPVRVARGGDVLAPDGPEYRTQFIDVRDLAEWILGRIEAGSTGVFNATGPTEPLPLGTLLDVCRRVAASEARFAWLPEAFLLEEGVEPWSDLPLWLAGDAGFGGNRFDIRRALAAGLTFRPLEQTVADTLAWARSRSPAEPMLAGLDAEREAAVLRAWSARSV
jgi:nucleoside-diphosphate-sugar epimerase